MEQSLEALTEISESASKEWAIEKAVATMKAEWENAQVSVKAYRDSGTYVLQGDSVEEIQTLLDDHIVKTQAMKGQLHALPGAHPYTATSDRIYLHSSSRSGLLFVIAYNPVFPISRYYFSHFSFSLFFFSLLFLSPDLITVHVIAVTHRNR